ncbi:hypothetical protein BDC45DRAFT_505925 [Circinella umbellata]|nr:hypothetical protein BDC45DRAFT_505916 [Circinella umbellata]KAI7855317.1 hypothetical protein BDC45DRAFT_505925 [Circinella umbellata]
MSPTCPLEFSSFVIDESHSHVSLFFKQYQASDWSLYNFCVWMRAVESNFNKVKQKWQSNLNLIKDLNIPRDLKRHVGELIEYSKKASKATVKEAFNSQPSSSSQTIIMHQPTINAMNFNSEITTFSATADNENQGQQQQEDELIHTNKFAVNPSLRSLYGYIYKLHQGKSVNMNNATKFCGDTLHDKLYKHCIELMKKYNSLTKQEVSCLHGTLSGIVNMLNKGDHNLMNLIPNSTLSEVNCIAKGIVDIEQERVVEVLNSLHKVYLDRGVQGVRVESTMKKATIISQGGVKAETTIEYKVYEIMEVIINELEYGNWSTSSKSETDCLFYWKKVFDIIFRTSNDSQQVHLSVGELTSTATKFERIINEYEFGETNKNVSGRKIDLLFQTITVNVQNKPKIFDLSSVEFKKMGSDDNYLSLQQNKNIRTMKSVLGSLLATVNQMDVVLGIDITGVSGYMFAVLPYEGVTFATNVTKNETVFLPVNKYDLNDFFDKKKYVLPLLFTYKDIIMKQAQAIDMHCREAVRERSVDYESLRLPEYQLPPTLYSPKR